MDPDDSWHTPATVVVMAVAGILFWVAVSAAIIVRLIFASLGYALLGRGWAARSSRPLT